MAMRRTSLEPGERDRIVTIQQLTEGVDDSGAPLETWTTLVSTMPAAKYDIHGREMFHANQLSARYDTRWEMNWRTDMDPDTIDVPKKRRLLYKGRAHDIVSASEIGRRDGLELLTLASTKIT